MEISSHKANLGNTNVYRTGSAVDHSNDLVLEDLDSRETLHKSFSSSVIQRGDLPQQLLC